MVMPGKEGITMLSVTRGEVGVEELPVKKWKVGSEGVEELSVTRGEMGVEEF